jgi:hypothetical protein
MSLNVGKEISALQKMPNRELRTKYREVFGEDTNANNHAWLIKRIAWRLQAIAEGDLSQRARQKASELARDADLRLSPPKAKLLRPNTERRADTVAIQVKGDDRLPLPGTVITRPYKGTTVQVRVLPHGFEYEGDVYKSLSAVAKQVTGQHVNGYFFFRLGKESVR